MSDPFSIASGVAGIVSLGLEVVKGLYEYCSTLKDQSSDISRIHGSLSPLHDLLGNLRRQLDARRFRSDDVIILACIEGRILQCKESIEELKKVADKFDRSQDDGFRAALKAKVRQATYPLQQSTLQILEESVDRIFQQVVFSLQLLQNDDAISIRNHVEDTKHLLEFHRASNLAQDAVKWLNAPDATINFDRAYEKSQPGTGAWLINGQPFNTWLQQESSFLWLYGFAGCGKSILCSTAIQHALHYQKSSQDIGVAFFFFAFDDTGKQDVSALLRALVLQLSEQHEQQSNNKQWSNNSRSSLLSRLYDSYRNSTPRNQVLLDFLHRLSRLFKHTYIMIDALDESPRDKHRQDVLDVLTTMRGWVEPAIHLLVTSRDEVDIRDTLDPSRDESIAVRNEASNKDIALYITQSLRDKPQLRKWKGFHGLIETTLTTQAEGVWVDCQLREIAVCPRTEEHLHKLLTSLPRTLDDTYERMLLAIPAAFQDYARQMLMLLCSAKRHLTIDELIYGMAVDLDPVGSDSDDADSNDAHSDHVGPGDISLDGHRPAAVFRDKRMLHDADAVLEVCPGFIEHYGFRDANQEETLRVRIAHFSVQEYLKSDRIKKRENVAQYHMQAQDINTQTTQICLAILDEFDESAALQAKGIPSHMIDYTFVCRMKNMFPWACYAATYWVDHFKESKRIPPKAVSAMLRFRPQAFRISTFYGRGAYFGYNPLQYATHHGLSSVVSVLLHEPNTDINEIAGGTTALIVAVNNSNMQLARYLLECNADVNGYDGGALQSAVKMGQVKMAKLFLNHGAKVDAGDGSALREALSHGHSEMIKLLVEHGADINAHGGQALQSAASQGHLEMTKLFLKHGAEINANGGRALQAAASRGHLDVAKLLLEHGADINVGGEIALTLAARGNHVEMAKLLLDRGVETDASGSEPLHIAARGGHLEMVKLLLEGGADASLVGPYAGRNALWPAVESNDLEVIRLLLEYGAEVNYCDHFGETVLHKAAAQFRNEDGVKLLLEHGAEANIADERKGRTALFSAASYGFEAIARVLLEGGADPNVVDKRGNTALSLAAKRGHEGMVTFLSNL